MLSERAAAMHSSVAGVRRVGRRGGCDRTGSGGVKVERDPMVRPLASKRRTGAGPEREAAAEGTGHGWSRASRVRTRGLASGPGRSRKNGRG